MTALAQDSGTLPDMYYPLAGSDTRRTWRGAESVLGRRIDEAVAFLDSLASHELTLDFITDESLHELAIESWERLLGQVRMYLFTIDSDHDLRVAIRRFCSAQQSRYERARAAAVERLTQHERFISECIFEGSGDEPLFPDSEEVGPGPSEDLDL